MTHLRNLQPLPFSVEPGRKAKDWLTAGQKPDISILIGSRNPEKAKSAAQEILDLLGRDSFR